MFDHANYHPETPDDVISIIAAGFEVDSFNDDDGIYVWGDDLADAISAAEIYAYNLDRLDYHLQDKVAEAVAYWNEEGDADRAVAALDDAFRIQK